MQEAVEEDLPDRIVQPELLQLRVTVGAVEVCGGVVVRGLALNGMAIAGMAVRGTPIRGTTQEARPTLIVVVSEGLPQVLQRVHHPWKQRLNTVHLTATISFT